MKTLKTGSKSQEKAFSLDDFYEIKYVEQIGRSRALLNEKIPFTIACLGSIFFLRRLNILNRQFLKGAMFQFQDLSMKKQSNFLQIIKLCLYTLNAVTLLSTVCLTGSQLTKGIHLRYFTPMKFEKHLVEINIKSIKSYDNIFKQ